MMSNKIVEERMAIGRGRHVNHTQYPLGARIFNTESFHIVQKMQLLTSCGKIMSSLVELLASSGFIGTF